MLDLFLTVHHPWPCDSRLGLLGPVLRSLPPSPHKTPVFSLLFCLGADSTPCRLVMKIGLKIFQWLEMMLNLPRSLFDNFGINFY